MEHSVVVEGELEAAASNLVHTYLELGRATPGASVWQERGFHACTGTLEHPICNFAIDSDLDALVASRLRQIAAQRRSFSLYTLPPNDSGNHDILLRDEGFSLSHKLTMFIAGDVTHDDLPLVEASEPGERRKVAEFMVDQFFHRQPASFRRGICEATAGSVSLQLLRAEWKGKTVGAVMVCEHAGMFGIYNLCVASQFRNRGWGSAIVKSVVARAAAQNCGVTLQCEPGLASWYGSLGFREVGFVSVYGLFRFKEIDIMG